MLPSKLHYEKMSDEELFCLIQQDDSKAFAALYSRYWTFLMNIAYRRFGSREKAEDLIQEIFTSFYLKRHQITFTVSLQAYLSQALKYKILNEFRSEHIRNNYKKQIFFNPNCKNDFANDVEAKDMQKQLYGIVESLPEKCKKVFYLSRYENKTNKDISDCLSISVSTVEKHIGKALKTIRKDLKTFDYSY